MPYVRARTHTRAYLTTTTRPAAADHQPQQRLTCPPAAGCFHGHHHAHRDRRQRCRDRRRGREDSKPFTQVSCHPRVRVVGVAGAEGHGHVRSVRRQKLQKGLAKQLHPHHSCRCRFCLHCLCRCLFRLLLQLPRQLLPEVVLLRKRRGGVALEAGGAVRAVQRLAPVIVAALLLLAGGAGGLHRGADFGGGGACAAHRLHLLEDDFFQQLQLLWGARKGNGQMASQALSGQQRG
mmetsp:Transcript_67804/g.133010  ORF Transcript_67804/g.133010 Transcript_67804/m.133010 type:complete len:235 (+) Transcript_67804:242-946(+)